MSQISKLVDSHGPAVFSVGVFYIVLVDLGQVSGKDTLSVGFFESISVLLAMGVFEGSKFGIKRQ